MWAPSGRGAVWSFQTASTDGGKRRGPDMVEVCPDMVETCPRLAEKS